MMQTKNDAVLQGFAPVVDQATHTLILGSFPGAASLRLQQYYAFQHNQFWRLLSGVLKQDFTALAYPDRLQAMLAHGIGLWDVFDACQRQGSLDSAIRQGELNDFGTLQKIYPNIKKLCFNGKTAGKMSAHFIQRGYQTLLLPSSSPAYAQMRMEEKLLKWQLIMENNAKK
ncbi:MAG: DNA-deoxyinosine glycosylase [Undibacterium sp.]|uniref:DNA-deoxyinosine glycosylase n=1 Tax=Undibacterium sp. TaxID=1914977 RepID=UPI0027175193|nr:DNA-deoxyinosine glycosylase [Undibacterium sp.]MDO8650977.1 DNA-deoxyinosine glycosylase [Undibacterium sp.]